MARYIWYIPEDDCEIGNVRTEVFFQEDRSFFS